MADLPAGRHQVADRVKEEPVAESVLSSAASVAAAAGDLSKEIEQSMERQADERIRVVRVFDNFYRCNWWVRDKTPHAFWLPAETIRKSRFVQVDKKDDRLRIKDPR
jgi:hypothetical protein